MSQLQIQQGVSLQANNTLATPARAEYYCASAEPATARQALEYARERRLGISVLGGGSNVVLGSELAGLWLHQQSRGIVLEQESEDDCIVTVSAGENWHQLVQWSLQQGLCGLENLALIPGTVGAAPIQNIGAYGVELERYFLALSALDLRSGETLSMGRAECKFAYRDSIFKAQLRDCLLIESVSLRLPRRAAVDISYPALAQYLATAGVDSPTPQQVFDAVVAIRSSKLPDPARVPNAGSFFKNPLLEEPAATALRQRYPEMPSYPQSAGGSKLAAAWLIEQCGFKGQDRRGARVHPEHALVLINPERCSGAELQAFAAEIVDAVQRRFGVVLEQEPRSYG